MARTKASSLEDEGEPHQEALKVLQQRMKKSKAGKKQDASKNKTKKGPSKQKSVGKKVSEAKCKMLIGDWLVEHPDDQFGRLHDFDSFVWSIFKAGNELWGSFETGEHEGCIKIDQASANEFVVTWRGRETGEGEICINDESQTGSFTLTPGGKNDNLESQPIMTGTIKGCVWGEYNFNAIRISKEPSDTQQQFTSYTPEMYERERVGRWR